MCSYNGIIVPKYNFNITIILIMIIILIIKNGYFFAKKEELFPQKTDWVTNAFVTISNRFGTEALFHQHCTLSGRHQLWKKHVIRSFHSQATSPRQIFMEALFNGQSNSSFFPVLCTSEGRRGKRGSRLRTVTPVSTKLHIVQARTLMITAASQLWRPQPLAARGKVMNSRSQFKKDGDKVWTSARIRPARQYLVYVEITWATLGLDYGIHMKISRISDPRLLWWQLW